VDAENVRCWIDFNNDGVFAAAENVFASQAIGTHNGNITIPLTAVLNTPLRMRIGSDRSVNSIPSPCINLVNGQFEDYTVTVISNSLPPVALAAIDSIDNCNGIVSFTDGSNNLPTTWLWYFGDGQTSVLQNPTHQYASSGVYQVSLVATNAFGSDSTSISVTVSVVSAAFTVSGLQQIGQTLQFTAATQTAATYLWNFGDGFLSTLINPTHIYTAAGSYPVTLTVTSGSCVVNLTDTIVILPVGIDLPEGMSSLTLLPNPFKDDVTIEFELNGEREISLQIKVTSLELAHENTPPGVRHVSSPFLSD
jgi:PKD repeat protein